MRVFEKAKNAMTVTSYDAIREAAGRKDTMQQELAPFSQVVVSPDATFCGYVARGERFDFLRSFI